MKIINSTVRNCIMLLFLITSKVSAQEVKITPELSKKIIDEHGINDFDVLHVKYKEIKYH
ncbi:hypothetical protein [Flavobacterium sp.]|uniref:hypothetical protein n=1 Tax=Flavobacterium sp. TaxID=239 RepID=UPI0026160A0F|nr:hypothetical protein [Flavobacterium sp.]